MNNELKGMSNLFEKPLTLQLPIVSLQNLASIEQLLQHVAVKGTISQN